MSDLPTPKTKEEAAAFRKIWVAAKVGYVALRDEPLVVKQAERLFPDPGEEAGRTELSSPWWVAHKDPEGIVHLEWGPTLRYEAEQYRNWFKPRSSLVRLAVVEEIPVAREPEGVVTKSGKEFRVCCGKLEARWPLGSYEASKVTVNKWTPVQVIEIADAVDPAVQALLSTLGGSNG